MMKCFTWFMVCFLVSTPTVVVMGEGKVMEENTLDIKNNASVGNDTNKESFCEMRSEGNRSSFCCFKGRIYGKCLPSFIIAGTQKSGTTALAAVLSSHPQISFSKRKELHFFDRLKQFDKGLTHYLDSFRFWNFENSPSLPHFGEATPFYIADRHACRRISETIPEAKMIILLREPVARAYSEYQMKKRRVESQDQFIDLVQQHVEELYKCLLEFPFKWPSVESCAPDTLVQHEHWGKFSSSVSRILKTAREKMGSEFDMDISESIPPEIVQLNQQKKASDGDMMQKELRWWTEMMITCFSSSKEKSHSPREGYGSRFSTILFNNETSSELQYATDIESTPHLRPLPSLVGTNSWHSLSESLSMSAQHQFRWVSKPMFGVEAPIADAFDNRTARLSWRLSLSQNDIFFQPLACLARHARETLTPLHASFEHELSTFKSCSDRSFVHGTLEEMDEALDSCITVKSGISMQYLYRSLYGVQIHRCMKYIPRENFLFISSESLKSEKSSQETMQKIMRFLNVSHEAAVYNNVADDLLSNNLQDQIDEKFPGFERSSGWKLESNYEPIPEVLKRKLSVFFKGHNEKLFRLINESFLDEWS